MYACIDMYVYVVGIHDSAVMDAEWGDGHIQINWTLTHSMSVCNAIKFVAFLIWYDVSGMGIETRRMWTNVYLCIQIFLSNNFFFLDFQFILN